MRSIAARVVFIFSGASRGELGTVARYSGCYISYGVLLGNHFLVCGTCRRKVSALDTFPLRSVLPNVNWATINGAMLYATMYRTTAFIYLIRFLIIIKYPCYTDNVPVRPAAVCRRLDIPPAYSSEIRTDTASSNEPFQLPIHALPSDFIAQRKNIFNFVPSVSGRTVATPTARFIIEHNRFSRT